MTPGAHKGLHLKHEIMSRFSGIIPDLGNGHRLFHGIIQSIALLSSEHIEDLDRAITLA